MEDPKDLKHSLAMIIFYDGENKVTTITNS